MNRTITQAFIVAIVASSCALNVVSAQGPPKGPPPASVKVAPAESREVGELRLVTGQVEAAKRSTVAAEEAGRVIVSPPPPGTVLKEGDVITRLDDTLLKIDLEAARVVVKEAATSVDETAAQLEIAKRNLKQVESLFKSNVAKQREVDDARDEVAIRTARNALAKAIVMRGNAAIARLVERIANTVIVAPLDGTITRKHAELGEWVGEGDPTVEMIATNRLRVRLNIPELMVAGVSTDAPVTVHVNALDRKYEAKPYAIVPDADVQARTFSLLIYLDNPDGKAKSGMSVSSQLPTGKRVKAMTIPRDALVTTPTGTQVYVSRGGAAVPVPVRVRFATGDRFVIDGPIRHGESVVTDGNERLIPGQPLNVVGENTKPNPE